MLFTGRRSDARITSRDTCATTTNPLLSWSARTQAATGRACLSLNELNKSGADSPTLGRRSFVRHDLLTRHALRHEKGKGKESTGDGVTLPSAVPAGTFINQQQQRLRMATVPSTSPYFQSSFTRSTLDIPVASTSTTPAYLAPELEFPLASTAGWSPPDDLGAGGDLSVFDLAGVSTLGSYEWLFNLSASTERVEEPLHAYANGHGTLAEEGFWAALAEEGLDAFQGPLASCMTVLSERLS